MMVKSKTEKDREKERKNKRQKKEDITTTTVNQKSAVLNSINFSFHFGQSKVMRFRYVLITFFNQDESILDQNLEK